MVAISSWVLLGMAVFILGLGMGAASFAEVAHHFVSRDGSFKFRWKGKWLCVRGNRK